MHFFSAYRNLVGITVTRYLDNNLSHNRWKVGNFKVSPDSDFPFVTVGVDCLRLRVIKHSLHMLFGLTIKFL